MVPPERKRFFLVGKKGGMVGISNRLRPSPSWPKAAAVFYLKVFFSVRDAAAVDVFSKKLFFLNLEKRCTF